MFVTFNMPNHRKIAVKVEDIRELRVTKVLSRYDMDDDYREINKEYVDGCSIDLGATRSNVNVIDPFETVLDMIEAAKKGEPKED